MSRQQQPHLTMMAPGDALRQEVFRSMNVSTSSKTPYSDATQVGHSVPHFEWGGYCEVRCMRGRHHSGGTVLK